MKQKIAVAVLVAVAGLIAIQWRSMKADQAALDESLKRGQQQHEQRLEQTKQRQADELKALGIKGDEAN